MRSESFLQQAYVCQPFKVMTLPKSNDKQMDAIVTFYNIISLKHSPVALYIPDRNQEEASDEQEVHQANEFLRQVKKVESPAVTRRSSFIHCLPLLWRHYSCNIQKYSDTKVLQKWAQLLRLLDLRLTLSSFARQAKLQHRPLSRSP